MLLAWAAIALLPVWALDNDSMRSRTVYQILTDRFAVTSGSTACSTSARRYCGGTYSGITQRLDYINGMGFDTIWISPIVQNLPGVTGWGEAYHGYWSLDVTQLNTNFGSGMDLKNMIAAAHSKGMYVMVDIVVNHVGEAGSSNLNAYGPFTQDDFHPFSWVNYNDQNSVEQGWLGDSIVALPDINTERQSVVDYWNGWVKGIIATYGFDAIRIDTVKHVRRNFWPAFTTSAGVFNQGEVYHGDPAYVAPYQNSGVNPFNYPVYYPLVRAFQTAGSTMYELQTMIETVQNSFADASLLGVFLNNHDVPRFEHSVSDPALISNAHAYVMVSQGIPYVYYGSEAGFTGGDDPSNREALWSKGYDTSSRMYRLFTALNKARRAAGLASSSFYTTKAITTVINPTDLVIAKGPLVTLLTSRGSSATITVTLPGSATGFQNGRMILDALSCQILTTGTNGDLTLTIHGGMPMVLIDVIHRGQACQEVMGTGWTRYGGSLRLVGVGK